MTAFLAFFKKKKVDISIIYYLSTLVFNYFSNKLLYLRFIGT